MDDKTIFGGIVVAVITAAGGIIAAIINARSNKKKADNATSSVQMEAGHDAYNAARDIVIHAPPLPAPPDPLLTIINEIRIYVNEIVIENQQHLSPLFKDHPNREEIRDRFGQLFEEQTERGNFGHWMGFLEKRKLRETNATHLDDLNRIVQIIHQLHENLYGYGYCSGSKERRQNYECLKHFVFMALGDEALTTNELRDITRDYLHFLRETVEEIGRIEGSLQAQC